MYYDFIAEFFANSNDAEPIYRTYVNGVQDTEGFIREKGFVKVADEWEGDFVLETDMECLNGWVDANLNPELLTICLEGEVCDRVRIYAFEYHAGEGSFIGFCYGDDDEYRVVFEGNRPDDKVVIETCGGPITAPLHYLKERFNVLTLFEVVDRLEDRIKNVLKYGLNDCPKS